MSLSFDSHSLYALFDLLGEQGRSMHLAFTLIDIFFPFAYVPFLTALLHQSSYAPAPGLWAYSPVLIGLFDQLQNFPVLAALIRYPTHLDSHLLSAAGYANFVKHVCLALVSVLVLVRLVYFFVIADAPEKVVDKED
ncbi:MAG: hypothetical protein SGCHY_001639 [Lobulomycetales sp.]